MDWLVASMIHRKSYSFFTMHPQIMTMVLLILFVLFTGFSMFYYKILKTYQSPTVREYTIDQFLVSVYEKHQRWRAKYPWEESKLHHYMERLKEHQMNRKQRREEALLMKESDTSSEIDEEYTIKEPQDKASKERDMDSLESEEELLPTTKFALRSRSEGPVTLTNPEPLQSIEASQENSIKENVEHVVEVETEADAIPAVSHVIESKLVVASFEPNQVETTSEKEPANLLRNPWENFFQTNTKGE
ncbi:hypothetical protein L2089_15365 [Paenibacillus hunanensis]|uniref:hypothetical protein n=1 Tax=Paenibacillus hunanensis TaxID=539262 RepID=UPI0020267632|nr:hypothetical protein [Paenibacillus hunanensis]MCL9662072.1 hypothetical protein [Paenibacillus hunanensis]